jgi:hypothetical protein
MTPEKGAAAVSDDIVTPGDCALVVAIPRTLSDLQEDLPRRDREFARRYVLPGFEATTAQGAWDHGYGAYIEKVAEVIADVRASGVTVVEDAGLSDLPRTFGAFKVVTFIAHGPFPLVKAADILDQEGVVRASRQYAPGPDGNRVIARLARQEDVREATTPAQLAKALNRIIGRTQSYYQATETSGIESRSDLTSLLVYEAFPGAFRPPAILELRDGIHDFESFCSIMPEGFRGTLEFLVCSALWFSEPLRRRRPNCGDILSPKQPAFLGGRVTKYRTVIRLLAAQPMRYTNAVCLVHVAERIV